MNILADLDSADDASPEQVDESRFSRIDLYVYMGLNVCAAGVLLYFFRYLFW